MSGMLPKSDTATEGALVKGNRGVTPGSHRAIGLNAITWVRDERACASKLLVMQQKEAQIEIA